MKSRFLFPNQFRWVGGVLTLLSLALGIAVQFFEYASPLLDFSGLISDSMAKEYFSFSNLNFTDELAYIGLIVGLLLLAFSKEKVEDEQISAVRLESLQWSLYFNYFILILCIIFVHGTSFLLVYTYNMFTILIFFFIRFRYMLYKQKRQREDDL